MLQTQFSRLKNITQKSSYRYNTIYLNEQNIVHFKNRLYEIQNEFDLLDYEKKGFLYRGEIEDYLQKKYQWVNMVVLNGLFNTMDWKRSDRNDGLFVYRDQFCQKYLKREKQFYYEYSKLLSEQRWFNSLFTIYQQTAYIRPSYYVSTQINKLELYDEPKEEFVNVDIRYEDHQEKLQFDINESYYDVTKPSYELILPAQQSEFFLNYNFTNVKNHTLVYGNSYVAVNLKKDKVLKDQQLSLEVRKNGIDVGRCRILLSFENNPEVIKQKLKEKSTKINENQKEVENVSMNLSTLKQKEYEYLQFLWGIKHIPSQQIEEQKVTTIILLRTVLSILLGGLGIVVHVLGRCEPLSIICVFMMLKWRTYVILKVEVFFMSWLIIAGMLLDGIWLVFSSHHVSQINYLNISAAMTLTYCLLGVKVLFFLYLLVFEKPFQSTRLGHTYSLENNNQLN